LEVYEISQRKVAKGTGKKQLGSVFGLLIPREILEAKKKG